MAPTIAREDRVFYGFSVWAFGAVGLAINGSPVGAVIGVALGLALGALLAWSRSPARGAEQWVTHAETTGTGPICPISVAVEAATLTLYLGAERVTLRRDALHIAHIDDVFTVSTDDQRHPWLVCPRTHPLWHALSCPPEATLTLGGPPPDARFTVVEADIQALARALEQRTQHTWALVASGVSLVAGPWVATGGHGWGIAAFGGFWVAFLTAYRWLPRLLIWGEPAPEATQAWTITPEGLWTEWPTHLVFSPWSTISRVVQTPDHLFLECPRGWNIAPWAAWSDPAAVAAAITSYTASTAPQPTPCASPGWADAPSTNPYAPPRSGGNPAS